MLKDIAVTFLKIFPDETRMAMLVAALFQDDVRVLVIEGEAFKAILRDRPEVAISVLRHMSTRVRQLNQQTGVLLAGG